MRLRRLSSAYHLGMDSDRRVVVCNYAEATKNVPAGARCYVVLTNPGNGHDRIEVLARSRGGRYVRTWVATKRLGNFRAVTIPPEHPRYDDDRLWDLDADALAERLAAVAADERWGTVSG